MNTIVLASDLISGLSSYVNISLALYYIPFINMKPMLLVVMLTCYFQQAAVSRSKRLRLLYSGIIDPWD